MALGRPDREQVVTTRATRGHHLAGAGTDQWRDAGGSPEARGRKLADRVTAPDELLTGSTYGALGRKPTGGRSSRLARRWSASPCSEGVEDLLWAMAMLPEFQLIY